MNFERTRLGFIEDTQTFDRVYIIYNTKSSWTVSLGVNVQHRSEELSEGMCIKEAFDSLQGNGEVSLSENDLQKVCELNPGQSYFVESYSKIIVCLKKK